jgi:hypothetical protein
MKKGLFWLAFSEVDLGPVVGQRVMRWEHVARQEAPQSEKGKWDQECPKVTSFLSLGPSPTSFHHLLRQHHQLGMKHSVHELMSDVSYSIHNTIKY